MRAPAYVLYTAWLTLCKYLKLHWEAAGVKTWGVGGGASEFKRSATMSEILAEKYQDINDIGNY